MAYNPDTMSFEEPNTDMVYVSGLPSSTTEEDIAAHFGSIGLLKEDKKKNKPKIWLYRDKFTNQLKVLVFPASLLSQCHQALNLQAFRLLLLIGPAGEAGSCLHLTLTLLQCREMALSHTRIPSLQLQLFSGSTARSSKVRCTAASPV